VWDTQTSTSNNDGRNSIVTPAYWPYDATWGAVTTKRRSMCYTWPGPDANWVEADIAFNPNVWWETSTNPPAPSFFAYAPVNSTLVALHEHGHGFGLAHETDQLATMNPAYPNAGPIGVANAVHPHADDARADRALYGTASTQRDVAAFAYHFYPDQVNYPGVTDPIPAPASVSRNAGISFKFAVENRGTVSLSSVPVFFYLSPNRNVTTASYFIGSASLSLNSGATVTPSVYLTIPAGAPIGYQYLGWIIDPYNSIVESDEVNNAVTLTTATYVSSNAAPSACFDANPLSGAAPLDVQFDAGCSSDPDGGTLTYTWDFGDGWGATGAQTANTYWDQGLYYVTLTVTDSQGASSSTSKRISVTCSNGGIRCFEEPM
jgi:PKD repeat protein